MLGVTSNNYFLAVSTLLTMLIALFVRYRISKRPKLGDATRLRVVDRDIWIDDYRMPRGEMFWAREQADFVFERLAKSATKSSARDDFLSKTFERMRAPLNVAFGFNETQIVQKSLEQDGPHAILIGSTGSGKTELLRHLVRELLFTETKLDLVCIDFKGGLGLDEFKGRASAFASDHDIVATQNLLDWLENELARRELSGQLHQSLIIAIDELAHLLGSVKKSAEILNAIAARGRSAKMHLVMTNQNLVGINRALLSNVKLRVLIGNPDPVDAAMLGQLARPVLNSAESGERGLARAQIVSHGLPAESFCFALPALLQSEQAKEQNLARQQTAHERLQHPSSKELRREYSVRGRARHRLRRQSSIRGLLSNARMAMSR